MRWIFLFFILTACQEEDLKFCMEISSAQPITFWLDGQQSFNNKTNTGVDKKCFFQPFGCDDEIKFQFKDNTQDAATLKVIDTDGTEVTEINFTEEEKTEVQSISLQFSTTEFSGGLGDWANANGSDRSSAASWITGSTPTSARAYSGVGGSTSKYFVIQRNDGSGRGWPPGNYTIELEGRNLSTFSDAAQNLGMGLYGLDNLTSQTQIFPTNSPGNLPTSGATTTITFSFTLAVYYEYLGVVLDRLGPPGGFDLDGRIISIELTASPITETVYAHTIYSASFTPSDESLCGQKVKFEIWSTERLAYSDYVYIDDSETTQIQYSNENNFAGLDYSNDDIFNMRVKSKFFKERFPEENESESLSDGSVEKLSSSVKKQKLLQIEPCPYYMHEKIKLILQHNYILIDGLLWEKEENYEMSPLNEKNPFELGSVWLTQKQDSYFTNVYGVV